MKESPWLSLCGATLLVAGSPAKADAASIWPSSHAPPACSINSTGVIYCTGSFTNGGTPTPEDAFTYTFKTLAPEVITVQTYGFGGGTNAAGAIIPAGGFDSLVALFSGLAASATILTNASGNPIASADDLINTNTGSPLFSPGCGPGLAGTVIIGSGASAQTVCGDNMLTARLGPGTYTILLTDAGFKPAPLANGSGDFDLDLTNTLDNYGDLTGGVFQTCGTNEDCISDTPTFALDIKGLPAPVPEPSSLPLLAIILVSMALASASRPWRKRRRRADSARG
jgi:hypothetical protein